MRLLENGEFSTTAVTVMRRDGAFGSGVDELEDGNMLPKLCMAVGKGACEGFCQADPSVELVPKLCAQENIAIAAETFGVRIDNLVIASATEDNVVFGDRIWDVAPVPEAGEYQKVPDANAFFFMPYLDKTLSGEPMRAVAMRMADCGAITFEFEDDEHRLVLGQAHFSRTNMRGPSAFIEGHEIDGERVSWAEYVVGQAIGHYGANPKNMRIGLTAAVEGKDFVLNYKTVEKMNRYYPGWQELGFLHPEEGKETDFDVLIDYREMIDWQIQRAVERFGLNPNNIKLDQAINTGDLQFGHASNHWAGKGKVEHGRDMYIVGVTDRDVELKVTSLRKRIVSIKNSLDGLFASASFEDVDSARHRLELLQEELKILTA